MRFCKHSAKREVYSNISLLQEIREPSNKQPKLIQKASRKKKKRAKKNLKVNRTEILKIRADINEKEMKETTGNINKTKRWFFEKINKIDKPLAGLIRKRREKIKIN